MRVFYIQNIRGALGPAVVDKKVLELMPDNTLTLKRKNKLLKAVELIGKVLVSDCVIMSSLSGFNKLAIKTAKLFKKKTIYYMHGSSRMESAMAGTPNLQKEIEDVSVYQSDKIICVSDIFADYVVDEFGVERDKITVIYNGIEPVAMREEKQIEPLTIITTGGGVPRKNNIAICKAVALLNEDNRGYRLIIVDNPAWKKSRSEFEGYDFVEYIDAMPHEDLLDLFSRCSVYVQNSYYETFCLAVAEAMCQGCSIVSAKNIGVNKVIGLTDDYIIKDNDDTSEIAKKIEYAFEKPNNKVLMAGMQWQQVSWDECVRLIKETVKELVG